MHEWFAQPVAAARIDAKRRGAAAHRLRIVRGRDLTTRLSGPLLSAAGRSESRLRQRRVAAAAGVACC